MNSARSACPSSSERAAPGLGVGRERAQVALVGEEGVLRQPALDPQVVEPGAQGLSSAPKASHGHRAGRRRSRTMRQTTSASPTRSACVSRT